MDSHGIEQVSWAVEDSEMTGKVTRMQQTSPALVLLRLLQRSTWPCSRNKSRPTPAGSMGTWAVRAAGRSGHCIHNNPHRNNTLGIGVCHSLTLYKANLCLSSTANKIIFFPSWAVWYGVDFYILLKRYPMISTFQLDHHIDKIHKDILHTVYIVLKMVTATHQLEVKKNVFHV